MSQQIADVLGKLDLMIAGAAPNGGAAGALAAAPASTLAGGAGAAAIIPSGSIRQQLAAAFQAAIDAAFPAMAGEPAVVVPCQQPKFGDYQCNNAMALHGKMKGKVGAVAGGAGAGAGPALQRGTACRCLRCSGRRCRVALAWWVLSTKARRATCPATLPSPPVLTSPSRPAARRPQGPTCRG